MKDTLEAVIKRCNGLYAVSVNEDSNKLYKGFLESQLRKRSFRILNQNKAANGVIEAYFELLVDKLYIFSIMCRKTSVQTELNKTTIADTFDKLKYLRVCGKEDYMWEDKTLHFCYRRRENGYLSMLKLPRYTSIIDEIGKEQGVVSLWGKHLSYKKDVGAKVRKHRFN